MDETAPPPAGPRGDAPTRPRAGYLAAAALVVAGGVASGFGAHQYRRTAEDHRADSFAALVAETSAGVDASLAEIDTLMTAVQMFFAGRDDATGEEFIAWYGETSAAASYPNVEGFGMIDRVRDADLPTYLARAGQDAAAGSAAITPPGPRPEYCLLQPGSWVVSEGIDPSTVGLVDVCALGYAHYLAPATESATISAAPVQLVPGTDLMAWFVPVYDKGVIPPTPEARRDAVVGWAGGLYDVNTALDAALAGRRGVRLQLDWVNPSGAADVVGDAGDSAVAADYELTVPLLGSWVLTVTGAPATGLSPVTQGAIIGTGISLVTLVLGAGVVLLSRSRAQALRLVDRRTGQLRYQALHDPLTGLPNRALVLDRAEQMLARAQRSHEPCAALFIDLDRFKDINDTFGHAAGDELLEAAATRLQSVLRGLDTVGRLGGDEFVVLVDGSEPSSAAPEMIAERLLEVLKEPFRIPAAGSTPLTVTASIGIADGEGHSASELLRDADVALYRAKESGRNCWVRFAPEMHTAAKDRLELGMDLRRALAEQQLFLVYQPTVDLATLLATGLEALVRWNHPTRGVVAPDQFIPLAEETGVIVDIGRWVLGAACERAAEWHRQGHQLRVSVNVSARQLEAGVLYDDVRGALVDSGLDPDLLVLEITESTLMADTDSTIEVLGRLKALGVHIAIDDFGTGYSSLAYLSRFPIDTIKIDRSFVAGAVESADTGALIHTLVQLGKTLGLETLAEGIEEPDQMQYLRDQQCDSGQGFLFARPLAAEQLTDYLAQGPEGARTPV